MENAVTTDNMY